MRYLIIPILLCSCTLSRHNIEHSVKKKPETQHLSTNGSNKLHFTYDLKEFIWEDSTSMTFFTITFSIVNHPQPITKKYRNFGGPLIIGNQLSDSCCLYPIFTKRQTSYFLIDDFIGLTDSLPAVTILGSTGYYNQGNSTPISEYGNIDRNELITELDSVHSIQDKNYATKEWYNQWINDHQFYEDQRTNTVNKNCK